MAHICPPVVRRPSRTNVHAVVSMLRSWIKPTWTSSLWAGVSWHTDDQQLEQRHFPAHTCDIITLPIYMSLSCGLHYSIESQGPAITWKGPLTQSHGAFGGHPPKGRLGFPLRHPCSRSESPGQTGMGRGHSERRGPTGVRKTGWLPAWGSPDCPVSTRCYSSHTLKAHTTRKHLMPSCKPSNHPPRKGQVVKMNFRVRARPLTQPSPSGQSTGAEPLPCLGVRVGGW